MNTLKLSAMYFFSVICATVILAQTPIDAYQISCNNSDNMPIIENEVNPALSRGMLDSVVVHFNDPNLEQVIRDVLGKPTGDIYDADMATLTSLTAHEKNITDLTGLEYAINLTQLDLTDNQISHINALAHLTRLKKLNFFINQLSDITSLQNLTNLTELVLGNNQISDVTPLQNLTNLTYLNILVNRISDISALQNLIRMERCYLKDNQIRDITALQNWTSIRQLWLENNQITDITPLQNLTNLSRLFLSENQISDISALQNLTKLSELELGANRISDVTALRNLTQVSSLVLSDNRISDIAPLQHLTSLRYLFLYGNQIVDLTPLQNLTALLYLYFYANQIIDIAALQNLTNLISVKLDTNRLDNEDLSNLYALDSLKTLYLYANPGIISGTAIQTLADNLMKMDGEDIRWDGTCGVDPDTAVICWVSPSDSAVVGENVIVQATATDHNQAKVQMKINWGDGNESAYSQLSSNAATFEFSHSYAAAGNYMIRVIARNEHGTEVDWSNPHLISISGFVAVANFDTKPVHEYSLRQNYPNPFNPATMIEYQLSLPSVVTLTIQNMVGQEIRRLIHETQPAGYYSVQWDGRDESGKLAASGMYLYRIEIKAEQQSFRDCRKMLLIR